MVSQLVSRQKRLIVASLCMVFFSFLSSYGSTSEDEHPFDFVLVDLQGKEVRLDSLADGKPLLLYFWATWCKPCRKTQPLVADIHKKYKDKIEVLGINVGGVDSPEDIEKYKSRHRIDYAMLMDRDNATVKAYGISAIPAIIVLDGSGRTVYRGKMPPTTLENLIPM